MRNFSCEKGRLIATTMSQRGWGVGDVLFVDDSARHIDLAVGICELLHVAGRGLSDAEIDLIRVRACGAGDAGDASSPSIAASADVVPVTPMATSSAKMGATPTGTSPGRAPAAVAAAASGRAGLSSTTPRRRGQSRNPSPPRWCDVVVDEPSPGTPSPKLEEQARAERRDASGAAAPGGPASSRQHPGAVPGAISPTARLRDPPREPRASSVGCLRRSASLMSTPKSACRGGRRQQAARGPSSPITRPRSSQKPSQETAFCRKAPSPPPQHRSRRSCATARGPENAKDLRDEGQPLRRNAGAPAAASPGGHRDTRLAASRSGVRGLA